MSDKTSADRRHEIRLLLAGFLLTTVVGGALTFFFQWLENRQVAAATAETEQSRLLEERRQQATDLFYDLSEVLDTRLYKWRQLAWGIEDGVNEAELQVRYADYRETLIDWVYHLNRRRAMLCRFFGPEVGAKFETEIMPAFSALQSRIIGVLRLPRDRRGTFASEELNRLADPLNNVIYLFNNELAEAIRRGDVGSTDPGRACDFSEEQSAS